MTAGVAAAISIGARSRRVADGFAFLEGPRWREGRLYVSDFYTSKVHAIDPTGAVETVCELDDQPSGLGFAPDGSLLVVSMKKRRLLRVRGSKIEVAADLSSHAPFHCNDMLVDGQGRAYIGNFGWNLYEEAEMRATHLLMVEPDGAVRVVADGLTFPNGMALTKDGRTLLVAESFAARITAFDVDSDGALRGRRTWAAFTDRTFTTIAESLEAGVVIPDGIALDARGELWIADVARRGPIRVAEGGAILEWIDTGESTVYAVALDAEGESTLYMCAGPPLLTYDPARERRGLLISTRLGEPGRSGA